MVDTELMKIKLKKYYTDIFDPSELITLVGMQQPFKFREIAVLPYSDGSNFEGIKRKLHVDNPYDLGKFFADTKAYKHSLGVAQKCYYGPQYQTPFTEYTPAEQMLWLEKDLNFDIDIDGSTKIREGNCKCVGKSICENCLEIAREAVDFAVRTLDEDFGIKKDAVRIYWSGARGYHVHYPSITRLSPILNDIREGESRKTLLSYIQYVVEEIVEKGVKKKDAQPGQIMPKLLKSLNEKHTIRSDLLRYRIETLVTYNFWKKTPFTKLLQLPWYENKATQITDQAQLKKILGKLWKAVVESPLSESPFVEIEKSGSVKGFRTQFKKKYNLDYLLALQTVMLYRYPRYDPSPVFDVNRLMKVPMSVDGSNGYLVQHIPYAKLFEIGLKDLVTIDHFVQ